jgi:excisionase family DNA binding protein
MLYYSLSVTFSLFWSTALAKTNPEFCSFDEALELLGTSEGVLKSMISEGELRAFREGDQMKFKREEVGSLILVVRRLVEVHSLLNQLPVCGFNTGLVSTWPVGHMWATELERITCTTCKVRATALKSVEKESEVVGAPGAVPAQVS